MSDEVLDRSFSGTAGLDEVPGGDLRGALRGTPAAADADGSDR
ncbi:MULTISPECIES: hypothetical protein [Halorussus]|nr:hypothetical protein [Halorussus vallis]